MSDLAETLAAKRTLILGVVAAVCVGGLAIKELSSGDPAPAASPAASGGEAPTVTVLPGAPPGDLASLRERYRPIVLKGIFEPRDFKKRSKPRPRKTPKPGKPGKPGQPKGPDDLDLRLTSFMGMGAARVGLFEDRSTGTALFAKAGKTMAGVSVASVGSDRVVVTLKGKRREFTIGESLILPPTARAALEPLRPKGSVTTETKPVTGRSDLPQLSEEKKLSILERLKARRRASRARAKAGAAEKKRGSKTSDDAKKTADGKTTADTKKSEGN
ncbi:MAG: hypothetical protein JKY65_32030 [Planctomycetes bacterium]|nr:hypothetical protein [Planctomycetota bacterium]